MTKNNILNNARNFKNDEFYTKYNDVNKLIDEYKIYLKNKIIYCNCDDYRYSNFYKCLKERFNELELKTLYCSNFSYNNDEMFFVEYTSENENIINISDGSFDSEFCKNILNKSDIVFTNPPFSLSMKFLNLINEFKKDYIIIQPYTNLRLFFKYNFYIDVKNTIYYFDNSTKRILTFVINTFESKLNSIKLKQLDSIEDYERDDKTNYIVVNKSKEVLLNYDDYQFVPISFLAYDISNQFDIITNKILVTVNDKHKFIRLLIKKKVNKNINI